MRGITTLVVIMFTLLTVNSTFAQARRLKQNEPRTPLATQEPPLRPNAAAKRIDSILAGGFQARLLARVLKLTDEQVLRMRQIRRRSAEEYIVLEAQIRTKRNALDKAIFAPTFNEEEVRQLATELARMEGQRVIMKTRIQSQIRQILTPEQIRILSELRSGLQEGNTETKPEASIEEPKQ